MSFNKFHFIHFFTILSFFCISNLYAQTNYKFEHIDLPFDVLDTKANSILEDSKGFIWLGFDTGVVIYDGYKGKYIRSKAQDESIQSFGNVNSLVEDVNGNIWVGTSNGVHIYNPTKETSVYINDSKINNSNCRSLSTTSKGEILISTENGFYIYNVDGEFLEQYIHQPTIENSLSHNVVRCSYEGNNGDIWIGTYDKLNLLDRKNKKITHFKLQRKDSLFHTNNLILKIKSFDKKNDSILLVGTETGLCLFNTNSKKFRQYSHSDKTNSISNSVVKSIQTIDDQIWLGTDLGLNIFDPNSKTFSNYYYSYNNSYSISNNVVWDLYLDSQRNLWVATDNGVDKVYLSSNNVLLNQFSKNSSSFKEGISIFNFSKQQNGNIWISTKQGAFEYDKNNNVYNQFLPPNILHNKVREIHCASDGLVWIVTSGGLNVYDIKKKKISNYVAELKGDNVLTTNYLTCVSEDSKGTIWIGTFNKGVFKVVKKKNGKLEFINFKHKPNDDNSLSSNTIEDIVFDDNDNVWIATNRGINCFYILNGVFERFTDKNTFGDVPDQSVAKLFFDQEKKLWISSYIGLYQWNPESNKFFRYNKAPINVTHTVAVDSMVYFTADNKFYYFNKADNNIIRVSNKEIGLKNINGISLIANEKILLSGTSGFASLNANDLKFKEDVANVQWTNFSISNHEIKPYTEYNSRFILNKHINATDSIILKYDENSFRIDFSSLPFNSRENVEYKYKLEDYESDWSIIKSGQNYVSYTQVRPGNYKLKVKASNNQGLFNGEERVLNIIVKTPFYLSIWALLFYLACFALIILFYRSILLNRERDKSELKFEKLEHQKSEELIALKTRFFTNITHELKTPLTLISSPVDDLLTKKLDEATLKSLSLVKKNTDRLKKLVNQILDIRKIEAGGEKLRIQKYDIIKFCNQIKNQFNEESIKRNIFLQFSAEPQSLIIWFDLEKVEKILFNLLSNAFKFTPNKGTIRVSIESGTEAKEEDNNYIFITVSDTGKGNTKRGSS